MVFGDGFEICRPSSKPIIERSIQTNCYNLENRFYSLNYVPYNSIQFCPLAFSSFDLNMNSDTLIVYLSVDYRPIIFYQCVAYVLMASMMATIFYDD